MISYLYLLFLLLSAGSLIYLSQKEYKHVDRYLWTLVVLIPIIILSYWLRSRVHTPEAALIGLCINNFDGTVLLVICLFTILKNIGIMVPSGIKIAAYGISVAHLFTIWYSIDSGLYYSSVRIEESILGSATITTSGPLKITHYIYLSIIVLAIAITLTYGIIIKHGFVNRFLRIYTIFVLLGMLLYLIEMVTNSPYSMLPGLYAIASLFVVFNYDRLQSHDILNLIGEKQSKTGYRGFAAFDKNRCLLGHNNRFAEMVPDINAIRIDEKIPSQGDGLINQLYPAIDLFEEQTIETQTITIDDKIYSLTVSNFSVNEKKLSNGYLLEIADITEETRQREIIEKYNEVLSKEVKEKTEHIADIQNTVVLGLANMVENRDDNTGGHIKRTSDIIRILMDEIVRRNTYELSLEKADAIIKAAPMHDLGKISIDNSILCKPARLTDEEFAIMKTHAAQSGEIVKIILEGVEEQRFVDVAYNLARHHHERWDGHGYPDQLLGEKIPMEARIMAVADVYDALVSKRCYKEAMSFEEADKIMNECMGSQFDPAMRPIFIACRGRLEEYYSKATQETSAENANA